MNCDMCGNDAELFRASIEGALMNVCTKCAKYGKVLGKLEAKKPSPVQKIQREEQPLHIINPKFPKLIKQKRESLNLKQEELAKAISEKESLIHKIETGSVVPNAALAKKLEAFLKIKLIEEYREAPEKVQAKKGAELTLGDFIKVRKK